MHELIFCREIVTVYFLFECIAIQSRFQAHDVAQAHPKIIRINSQATISSKFRSYFDKKSFLLEKLNKLLSHTAQPRRRAEPHALPRRQLRGQRSASQRAWRISACTSELCCALSHATGAAMTRGCSPAAASQPHAIVQQPLAAPPTRVQPQQAARGQRQHCRSVAARAPLQTPAIAAAARPREPRRRVRP